MKLRSRVVDNQNNVSYGYVLTIDNEDFEAARELAPLSMPYVDMKIVYDGIEVDLTQSEFNQMMDEALYKIVKERI